VLPVPAIDHARAPSEEATCEERGQGEGEEQQVVSIREMVRVGLVQVRQPHPEGSTIS